MITYKSFLIFPHLSPFTRHLHPDPTTTPTSLTLQLTQGIWVFTIETTRPKQNHHNIHLHKYYSFIFKPRLGVDFALGTTFLGGITVSVPATITLNQLLHMNMQYVTVLTLFLYVCEAWTTFSKPHPTLEQFHQTSDYSQASEVVFTSSVMVMVLSPRWIVLYPAWGGRRHTHPRCQYTRRDTVARLAHRPAIITTTRYPNALGEAKGEVLVVEAGVIVAAKVVKFHVCFPTW